MPMRLGKIPKFEKMNNLTINVYMTNGTGKIIDQCTFQKEQDRIPSISHYYQKVKNHIKPGIKNLMDD